MTTGHIDRQQFLGLSWPEQKRADLRKVLDPGNPDVDLGANCIQPGHRDTTASMVVYRNGVWCFGCRTRWWPDQFLRTLGDRPLTFDRGNPRRAVGDEPEYIPWAKVVTYRDWLWKSDGHYKDRRKFLLDRGLTREICELNEIGHTGEAFTIPVFYGPSVQAIRYRRDDELAADGRPKYWGTPGANKTMVYNPVGMLDPNKKTYGLILCEGELDALRVAQAGYHAASLTNGCNALTGDQVPALKARLETIRSDTRPNNKITLCYDQDPPGRAAALAALPKLWACGIPTQSIQWDPMIGKDVTEYMHSLGGSQVFDMRMRELWPSSD